MDAGDLISGKYRLQRVLGAGSMGSVWAARNELTNRDFAIKFLLPELSKDEDSLHRFFLEARACGQIRHPAIVDVYDMGQADDASPYIVMELLEGEGFDHRLSRQGKMRPVDVCRYVAIVARGLEEAHTRGLIHRDLKPGNIFFAIDKAGDVFPKVLDFGISKDASAQDFDFVKTSTGTVLGSPAYMSPEQARGESDVDARSDIWALGVIIYESLSGKLPFDARNYNALMLRIITKDHEPLRDVAIGAPPALCMLVDEILHKDRDRRVNSAAELADRLETIYATLTDTPILAPERQLVSIPPQISDGTTQDGWFKVRTASGQSKVSPAVWVGAAIAFAGVLGGIAAVSSSASASTIPTVERLGINAMQTNIAHARSELTETLAHETTQEAELAQKKAEDALKEAEDAKKKKKKKKAAPKRRHAVENAGF